MIMKTVAVAFFAVAAMPGLAAAQDAYVVDDDDVYVESPEVYAEPGVVVGPRVYGWTTLRPANCGTFKYWNGEYCADARFDPPDSEAD